MPKSKDKPDRKRYTQSPNTNVVHHVVTDQGNGGWYCDCGARGFEAIAFCPSCGTWDSDMWVNPGGSDF